MNRVIALFAVLLAALALPGGLAAQQYPTSRTIATERWVEQWDPASESWVRVSDHPGEVISSGQTTSVTTTQIVGGVLITETQIELPVDRTARFALPFLRPLSGAVSADSLGESLAAQYGPFRVLDARRAAIVGSTDQMSPAYFEAMLRDYPGLEVLEMIEAPGTRHDIANLQLGRMIRAAGLSTHVPSGGSVRSGAVELFLAGATRTMDDGAQFAVHSWLDNHGREPGDFPEDHPANRLYLDYYVEMGMSEAQARAFYAMTNSVPHSDALWLGASDMRAWVPQLREAQRVLAMDDRVLPVSVMGEGPLDLSFAELDLTLALAVAPQMLVEVEAAPAIAYADLAQVTIALNDATLLDSRRSFP